MTNTIPFAIIAAPISREAQSDRNPTRMATRRWIGIAGCARKDITVKAAMIPISVPPPTASSRATTASNVVSRLKCDGTPRHVCSDTRAVSTTDVMANAARSLQRERSSSRRNDVTQVMVMTVRPNESPNVAGFRHDSGPLQDAPLTIRIARCTSPLAISAAPTVYPARATARSRRQKLTTSELNRPGNAVVDTLFASIMCFSLSAARRHLLYRLVRRLRRRTLCPGIERRLTLSQFRYTLSCKVIGRTIKAHAAVPEVTPTGCAGTADRSHAPVRQVRCELDFEEPR